MRAFLMLVISLAFVFTSARAADAPTVPLPTLPDAYKAYMIDPDSVSPDGKYGVMYLSEMPDDDNAPIKNFVVALKPFSIVVELPKSDDAYFANKNHADFAAHWAKDSSAVVVMQNSRWGPGTAFVVPIHAGKAGPIVDLTAIIAKYGQADLDKVKHEHYNETYDFVFAGDTPWTINDKGQVEVDVDCTTNPKRDPDTLSWDGHFAGLWDIAQAKFVTHEFKRTFYGMHKETDP